MRYSLLQLPLIFVLALAGCTTSGKQSITPGTYVSRATNEKVIATLTKAYVELRIRTQENPAAKHPYVTEFEYGVINDDSRFCLWAGSSGGMANMAMYRWWWDGYKLTRKSRWLDDHGETVDFLPIGSHSR
jgi:hypothetical protein